MSPSTPDLYYLMNFNTMTSSFVTLFQFTVINNWFVTIEMIQAVTETQFFPMFYFVVWWICVVLVLFNVLIALIIEIYQSVEPEVISRRQKIHLASQLTKYDHL